MEFRRNVIFLTKKEEEYSFFFFHLFFNDGTSDAGYVTKIQTVLLSALLKNLERQLVIFHSFVSSIVVALELLKLDVPPGLEADDNKLLLWERFERFSIIDTFKRTWNNFCRTISSIKRSIKYHYLYAVIYLFLLLLMFFSPLSSSIDSFYCLCKVFFFF